MMFLPLDHFTGREPKCDLTVRSLDRVRAMDGAGSYLRRFCGCNNLTGSLDDVITFPDHQHLICLEEKVSENLFLKDNFRGETFKAAGLKSSLNFIFFFSEFWIEHDEGALD